MILTLAQLALPLTLALASPAIDTQQQPHISPPKHSVFRDIVWGDLNFAHTTDTHGWYAGHINQKQYSGDWGDLISFSHHLRNKAASLGVDMLFVDTGDKHDGNGLSDASSTNGLYSTPIFNRLDYDLVTIGNHELYTSEISIQEYEVSVNHFQDRYVSTNVEFLLENGTWTPFGNRYRYFTTPQKGSRVLALSFLFNFKGFNSRTRVTSIVDTLKQDSFNEILESFAEDSVDVIVIYGHIPVTDIRDEELVNLHVHLRRRYPNTIIQYFGGHSHIRDFAFYDNMATGLQSGRYCETVGWLSINTSIENAPVYNRRYIDFNRESFIHHSDLSSKGDFDTKEGLALSKEIAQLRLNLNLTDVYGYVPRSYLMNAYPFGHESSVFTLMNTTILPMLDNGINRSTKVNRVILVNSGSVRYDLYEGEFTKDTEFIVSPFRNNWVYLTVPKRLAALVAPYLNRGGVIIQALAQPEEAHRHHKQKMLKEMTALNNYNPLMSTRCHDVRDKKFKNGLTTIDDFGCDGDDVRHNTIPYYPSPNIIASYDYQDWDSELADLVFYDFVEPWILDALNVLSRQQGLSTESYKSEDVKFYGGLNVGKLLKQHFTTK